MRVSEYFELGKTQPYLDFVDIRLDTDIKVFIGPTALKSLRSAWGHECSSLVQHYFETVLGHIKSGAHTKAQKLLSCLNERNEFHLGYSSGQSKGHAFGEKSAKSVWNALCKSQASVSGLLEDLEDTCLLIDNINHDKISDAVCNVIRGPLIKYTQSICDYYGIPLTPDVVSGPIWNPVTGKWEIQYVPLPMTDWGKVILVPKVIVRHKLSYDYKQYYTHYLLPIMQEEEINANTALVKLLKNGNPRVTKKDLRAKYGSDKLAVVEQTLEHPRALKTYKHHIDGNLPRPLSHENLAAIGDSELPDLEELVLQLDELPTGREYDSEYEDLIEKILSCIFYPSLCNPQKQHKIHDGRKRIDITYTNEAREGFFAWIHKHYPSALIFVECKNYGKEVGNPELDQLAGRFSPSRGKVGILVCRSVDKPDVLAQRCIDTAKDDRGYMITLTDSDIKKIIDKLKEPSKSRDLYPLLMEKFKRLIL